MNERKKSRWVTVVGIIVGGAGIGVFGSLLRFGNIKPWAAAAAALLWATIVGLLVKVWARLEATLVDLLGSWLDGYVRDFAAGYKRKYLNHLMQRHRTFDVKGLSTQNIILSR